MKEDEKSLNVCLCLARKEKKEKEKAVMHLRRKFHSRKEIKKEMVDGRTQGVEILERKYVSV